MDSRRYDGFNLYVVFTVYSMLREIKRVTVDGVHDHNDVDKICV